MRRPYMESYDCVVPLGDEEPVDGFSARKLRNYYLLNPEETGDRNYKLLLSQTDKKTLTAIVSGSDTPEDHSIRVQNNFEMFETPDREL